MTQQQDRREVELKLAVAEGAAETLMHNPAIQAVATGKPSRRHQVTTYFDTANRALERCGVSLRVRRTDGRYVQTVKADRRDTVAADRAEWEWDVAGDRPDLSLLRQTGIADTLAPDLAVEPVFTTEIDRTSCTLALSGGACVEVALDEGRIIAGDAHEPVRELELELRKGDPGAIYRLALMLHASAPVTILHDSKSARGYRLRDGSLPCAHKAADLVLPPKSTVAEALGRILEAGLSHLLVNRPAALRGDIEGVHQMRVAIRRLRAALTMFKPHLEATATSHFEAALRRIGPVFGEARDWDVFCQQILPDALADGAAAGWREVLEAPAAIRRAEAHRRVAAEIHAPPFTALVIGLAAWAAAARDGATMLGDPKLAHLLAARCTPLLDRLADKVNRRGRHIERRSDAQLHALRKSLKKLRYGIDFVASVYPPEITKPYLKACKKLQRVLGDINDTVAATGLADHLAGGSRPDLAPAIGALAMQLERQRIDALRRLAKRWYGFNAQPRFWG